MAKKSSVDDVLPLSPTQEGMLFHALFDDNATDVYTGQLILEIDGELDARRLRRAAESLLSRHANLRAEFRTLKSGKAVQVLRREVRLPWRELDLTGVPVERRAGEIERVAEADRAEPFDLAAPPLLRFLLIKCAGDAHKLLLASHHLLWDGWSAPILVRELFALYAGDGDPAALPRVRPYRDYLTWLSAQDRAAAESAWREALAGLDEPTLIAPAAAGQAPEAPERVSTELSAEATAALAETARAHGLTVNTVLQGLWAIVLAKLTGRADITFGATASGRPAELAGVETMVGLFINTLPVRVAVRPDESLLEFLGRLQAEQARLLDHQHLGLADIQRLAGHPALFDTLLVLESYPIDDEAISGTLAAEGLRLSGITVHDATHYPLSIIVMPGERLSLTLGYQPSVFSAEFVREIAGWLARLIEAFVADPEILTGRIDLLPAGEMATLAAGGDGAPAPIPDVRELLAEQVARDPRATAVVFGDTTYDYAGLSTSVAALADVLFARGAGPEHVVAVALPRSVELVVALLATIEVGAAYLPVDVGYPAERIELMLADTEPSLVICEPDFAARHGIDPARVVRPTERGEPRQPRAETSPEHPAYVVFTSGSTGRPKGVVGTRRALANRLAWARTALSESAPAGPTSAGAGSAPAIRVAKSPVSFIDGTTELLTGLVTGQTVVLADDDTAADPLALAELIDRQQVNVVTVVPSLLSTLVTDAPPGSLRSVTTWITSGEPLPPALVDSVRQRWPAARVINLYGCSEAAGDSLAELHGGTALGRPITNTRVHVLDRFLRPLPDGVTGELYLAGNGLARGYLSHPGRTAERFVANPFGPPGSRLYRTGDLARRTAEGVVEFAGRADDQVKIRGFRVEPAEIEAHIGQQPGVRATAVVVRPDTAQRQRLIGYVVPEDGAQIDGPTIRRDLASRLPAYLVPSALVVLDALPRTPSGKLDRRRLPEPDFGALTTSVPPRDEQEKLLCGLFREVLGVEGVGVHDNFFELGGNSIVSVRLVSMARNAGLTISPSDVFRCQTVAQLATVAATAQPAAAETPAAPAQDQPLVSLSSAQRDKVMARWRS